MPNAAIRAVLVAALLLAAHRAGEHVELRESAWLDARPQDVWPLVEHAAPPLGDGEVVEREAPWLIVRHVDGHRAMQAAMLTEERDGTRVDWIVRGHGGGAGRRIAIGTSVRGERRALRRALKRLSSRRTRPLGGRAR